MYCSNNHGNGSDCGTFASILRYQARTAAGEPCDSSWRLRGRRNARACMAGRSHSGSSTPVPHAPDATSQAEASFNKRKVDLSIAAHMHG